MESTADLRAARGRLLAVFEARRWQLKVREMEAELRRRVEMPHPLASLMKGKPMTSTPMTVQDLLDQLAHCDHKLPIKFNNEGLLCHASGIETTTDSDGTTPIVLILRDSGS